MVIAPALEGLTHRRIARPVPPLAEVADGFRRYELFLRASAIAFRALYATIPFALFVLALAGLLSLQSLWTEHLAPSIAPHVSPSAYEILDSTARNVLGSRQVFWVTVGFALMLWETSAAVRAVMSSFDAIYASKKPPSTSDRLLTSVWLALACGTCIVGAVAALNLLPLVLDGIVGTLARYLLAALLLWLTVTLLVRFAPATPQPLGWVSFGSGLVIVGWLVTWAAYGLYLTHLSNVGSAFGAFAAVIILLAFLQLSALVLLAGTLVDTLVREEVTGDRQGK
jgi:membrane protein